MINLWDGQLSTLQNTNLINWQTLANLNHRLATTNNPFLSIAPVTFDLSTYDKLNRNFRNTFINNALIASHFLESASDQCHSMLLKHDNSFIFQVPIVPRQLPFDTNMLNSFWRVISEDYLFLFNTANANNL